ncbi:MAG: two-component system, sensor histidine kinase and response regulator [Bacteroidales bacterium]|nr:two-component system, sensor histidine kinase and response regulator [Bacteroidales bacterium]
MLKGQLEGVADGVLKLDEHRIALFLAETQKLTYMINDLSLLTHLESPGYQVHTETVWVDEVIVNLLSRFEVQAKERGMQFSYNPLSLRLQADKNLFTRLLDNLISNAVKYNKTGGSVECILSQTENEVVLEVKDTGIGMTQEEAARLFQEFVRIKNEKTKEITGTGLGLSIVKKIVTTYAGTITVESTPDIGSRFIVKIPYKSEKLN